MAGLDTQWKALVKQLKKLEIDTRKARGDARAPRIDLTWIPSARSVRPLCSGRRGRSR